MLHTILVFDSELFLMTSSIYLINSDFCTARRIRNQLFSHPPEEISTFSLVTKRRLYAVTLTNFKASIDRNYC